MAFQQTLIRMLQKPGPDCSLSETLDFECAKITVSSLRSATLVQEGIYMQFGYYLKQKLANTEAQELLVLVGKVVEETLFKGSSGVEFNVSTEDLGAALGASIKMEGDRDKRAAYVEAHKIWMLQKLQQYEPYQILELARYCNS